MSASDREEAEPAAGAKEPSGTKGREARRRRGDAGKDPFVAPKVASDDKEEPRAKDVLRDVVAPEGQEAAAGMPHPGSVEPADGAENKWVALISKNLWIAVPLLLPAAIVVGMIQGAQAVLLLLIGAALVGVIALFWGSLRTLLGETPLSGADAYAIAAPRAEEEQKQAVLRALKDLEFERSVGKISDEDYAALVAKYRAEAKRLLRVIEEEARPRRERVEWLVHERLAAAGLAPKVDTFAYRSGPAEVAAKPDPKADAKKGKKGKKMKGADKPVVPPREVEIFPAEAAGEAKPGVETTLKSVGMPTITKESPAYVPPSKLCASCGAKNDPDANFCKKCGSKAFEGAKTAGVKVVTESAPAEKSPAIEAATRTAGDDEASDTVRDESAENEAAENEAAENEASETARGTEAS